MQNPDQLVQRSLETLDEAESSGLQFVEVKLADVAGKHWRGKMQSLLPVSTESPPVDAERLEAVKAPDGLSSGQTVQRHCVDDAVTALAEKFKTPKIQPAKSTQSAKVTKTSAAVEYEEQVIAPVGDKTQSQQPAAPPSAPDPVRVEKTEVEEVAPVAPVPPARQVDSVIDVGEFGSGKIPVESPDVPLTKKKRKRKNKEAKAAETSSAMSWTMRR